MDRILDNKLVVVVAVALFVVALSANSMMGGPAPAFVSSPTFSDSAMTLAHGPTLPPEPWMKAVKPSHGPTLPPEPWVAKVTPPSHGPTLPPEPWVAKVTAPSHGPTLPPEPWKL